MKKTFLNTLTPEEIINRLKNGEVVKRMTTDCGEKIYKMVDGILVTKDKDSITINGGIIVDESDDYYFEEEEPFEITETGVYKTRDGRKAFVYKISDDTDDIYPIKHIIDNPSHPFSVTKNGRFTINEQTEDDIVAKWED